jgi:hypothetical protein
MAYMTEDGSIVDGAGKVIFFSAQRFVDDICLGKCCFICGARPEDKPFNLFAFGGDFAAKCIVEHLGDRFGRLSREATAGNFFIRHDLLY